MELSIGEIADLVNGRVIGDGQLQVTGINSLDKAKDGDISFFYDARYSDQVNNTQASALVVAKELENFSGPQIAVSDPRLAYALLAGLFAPRIPRFNGVSDKAYLHESASTGKNVSIYPMVYIGENTVIGDNVILFPGVFVGDRVKIGNNSVLYANVSVMQDCVIGENVTIHPGTVIGADGFGYVPGEKGNVKIPQLGNVQIDDDVEIGANSTVDRAAHGTTHIKRGVKIDNLVQVAHNVVIGEDSILVALSGISGSVDIGRNVIIGGQVGIKDHIKIGDRAQVGSAAGVHKSLDEGEAVLGNPALPPRLWIKTRAFIERLPEMNKKLREMEKRLKELEEN